MKIEGSGSISHRHGSADPDQDPHQNVMDPEHWLEHIVVIKKKLTGYEKKLAKCPLSA